MRGKMYKKGRKKSPLPEIQEESLADPLLHRIRTEGDPEANGSSSDEPDSHLVSNIQKAAALVDQAMQGRWMPLDVVHHKDYLSAKQAFLLYHHLRYPRCVVLVTLITLSLFEVPSWCTGPVSDQPCGDPEEHILSGIPYLPQRLTLAIEVVCLLLLAWSVGLQRYFKFLSFWNNHITVVKVVLLFTLFASICVSQFECLRILHGRKVSMYLRVLIPILFSRALRGCFRVAIRILEHFVNIAVLVLVYVLLSAWLATLVMNSQFKSYSSTLLKLFSLLTAASDSDVWAATFPDRLAIFFLFIYLVVGLFFLMNVVFAVIYTNFKAQMAVEAKKQITARQGSLRAAFSLLDTRQQEWIDGPTMIALFLAIGNYRHIPDVRSRTSHLFLALNKRGDFKIWSDDFEDLCDVIAKEVARRPKAASFSRYQQFEMMWVIGHLQFVKSAGYSYVIWAATLGSFAAAFYERHVFGAPVYSMNYFAEIIESAPKFMKYVYGTVEDDITSFTLFKIEFTLGSLFLLDACLKILVLGRRACWKSALTCFDIVFAFITMGVLFPAFVYPAAREWVSILLLLRAFRVIVIFSYFKRWKLLSEAIVHMVAATAPILGMLFCICSLFSLLGVHLFAGDVYLSNPRLIDTQYSTSGLWVLNFNDYASATATCLNLCIVGNWYIIMEGYVHATGSHWSRLYFISFWFITVAFMLSVVVSYFIEAFTMQMEKARARERALAEEARKEALLAKNPGLARQRAANPGHFMIFKKTVSYYNLPPRRQ